MTELNFNDVLADARYAIQKAISEKIKKSNCNRVSIKAGGNDFSFVKNENKKWDSAFYGHDMNIELIPTVIFDLCLRYGFDKTHVEFSKIKLNGCKTSPRKTSKKIKRA